MKKTLFIISSFLFTFTTFSQQCFINASASSPISICGDCLDLTATGTALGSVAFSEDFDNGSPTGWAYTQSADFTNPCSPGDGTSHLWMGDASGNPRDMETVDFDLTVGGMICFDMLYATQGTAAPCEGPDLSDEGVYIQYSTDGGTTWITIDYWDPNGGNDPQLTNWNTYCVQIPIAAQTSSTRIRWHQDDVSGSEFDHWGLDDVTIALTDSTSEIEWVHDLYSYGLGNPGGVNPTPVCPKTDTFFVAKITADSNVCYDTVNIIVNDPTIEITMADDSLVCPGTCVQIQSDAKVIVSPGGVKTYSDGQFQAIVGGLGSTSTLDINVADLNMDSILPGSIQNVCIDGLTYNGFPSGDVGSLDVKLICPSGGEIILVPQSVTSGGAYTNTCFVPVGGSNISTGSNPYTGNWASTDPFSDLDSCLANGAWTIEITNNSTFGAGTFSGWSITFDDIEISYPAVYSWNPTGGMIDPDSLDPTVCPNVETTYTLTAIDSNNCTSVTDSITIMMDTCCQFSVNIDADNAVCGDTSGAATLIVSGTYGYTFQWGPAANFSTDSIVTGLQPGFYGVSVTDSLGAGCTTPISVYIGDSMTFNLDTTAHSILDAGCITDGSVTGINITGGVNPIIYDWTNITGATVGSSIDLLNIIPGSYQLHVSDSLGCEDSTGLYVVNQSTDPNINENAASISNIGCITTTGGVTGVFANGGTPNYNYTWYDNTNSPIQTTSNLTGVGTGTYYLVVVDSLGCRDTSNNFTIINNPYPVLDETNAIATDIDCQNLAGSVTGITSSNGTNPHTYDWTNTSNTSIGSSADLTNIFADQYILVVTDANGCKDTSASYTISNNTTIFADFISSTNDVFTTNTTVNFTDQSSNGNSYTWLVYNSGGTLVNTINNVSNPSIDIPAIVGCYDVVLALNNGFCNDTATDEICVTDLVPISVPNIISPNGDAKNDFFVVANLGFYANTRLEIVNRWGQTVYENDNYDNTWNGTTTDKKELSDGVYYYELSNENWTERVVGNVTIMR